MAATGTVIAGNYPDANVSTDSKGEIFIKSGKKRVMINIVTVSQWELISIEGRLLTGVKRSANFAGNVFKTTAGSLLTGDFWPEYGGLGKERCVARVEFNDGKYCVIKLTKDLLSQLEFTLEHKRVAPAAPPAHSAPPPTQAPPPPRPAAPPPPTPWSIAPPPAGPPIAPPSATPAPPASPSPTVEPDLIEQIAKLAVLRDQGILSEDEFALKKAELLARL